MLLYHVFLTRKAL